MDVVNIVAVRPLIAQDNLSSMQEFSTTQTLVKDLHNMLIDVQSTVLHQTARLLV